MHNLVAKETLKHKVKTRRDERQRIDVLLELQISPSSPLHLPTLSTPHIQTRPHDSPTLKLVT